MIESFDAVLKEEARKPRRSCSTASAHARRRWYRSCVHREYSVREHNSR